MVSIKNLVWFLYVNFWLIFNWYIFNYSNLYKMFVKITIIEMNLVCLPLWFVCVTITCIHSPILLSWDFAFMNFIFQLCKVFLDCQFLLESIVNENGFIFTRFSMCMNVLIIEFILWISNSLLWSWWEVYFAVWCPRWRSWKGLSTHSTWMILCMLSTVVRPVKQ